MATQSKPRENGFKYGDYLLWPDDERWELIDGVPYNMTPAPSRKHQEILVALTVVLQPIFAGENCRLYVAPFDVRLPEGKEKEDEIRTVVQPDLVVVCDPQKLDEKGCVGAPDLIVEITSPSTAGKDLKEKLDLYERRGVREYWIVHPTDETVMVFRQDSQSRFGRPEFYTKGDTLRVGILPDFSLLLDKIFKE